MAQDDDIPILEVVETKFSQAAGLLERAAQAAGNDPSIAYMVALAHKRDDNPIAARAAFRKIQKPDANVFLQLSLLSLKEGQPAQAEEELARAWQMEPTSFAIAHNLAMVRLSLMQFEPARKALAAAVETAPSPEKRRLLQVLDELAGLYRPDKPGDDRSLLVLGLDSLLENLTKEEEQQVIRSIRGLGSLEACFALMRTLHDTRPNSPPVQEAYYECAVGRARELMNRSRWTETVFLLEPLVRGKAARPVQAALHNLLGCCGFITSDFEKAVYEFGVAVKLMPNDLRLRQNLALSYEKQGDLDEAEKHWTRFLEMLGGASIRVPPGIPHYQQALEYESLLHLASAHQSQDRWNTVLNYLTRASRLRPDDADLADRIFHCCVAGKQTNRARRALDDLRRLRPGDPQIDLYELDLVEVKSLSDIERMMTEIEHVMRRHPDDHRVNERAVGMVGNVVPLMGNLCDQLTDRLNKLMRQVNGLPHYQVNWSAVNDAMRDLVREFQKLKRITAKCLPLVNSDEHKRIVRDLMEHIDQKIEACREMGG